MPTEEKEKERQRVEPTPAEEKIPPELAEELKNKNLASESDFIFVKKIEDINEDIVKVHFETPFSSKELEQKFVKPDADASYNMRNLKELYDEVSANVTQPSSILEVSIPSDTEVINANKEHKSTDSQNWIPQNVNLYEKETLNTYRKAGAILSIVFGVAVSVLAFDGSILSIIFSIILIISSVSITFRLAKKEYKQPKSSERLFNPTEVSEGDVLVLDKSSPTSESDREVCRVVDEVNQGIEVMIRDGRTVALSYDNSKSEWSIHDFNTHPPTVEGGYESVYLVS